MELPLTCRFPQFYLAVLCSVLPGDHVKYRFEMELVRMGFDLQNVWRVSDINNNYK